jgi:hypothetical protein
MKHNADEAELKAELEGGGENHTIEGEALNAYAKVTQNDPLR